MPGTVEIVLRTMSTSSAGYEVRSLWWIRSNACAALSSDAEVVGYIEPARTQRCRLGRSKTRIDRNQL